MLPSDPGLKTRLMDFALGAGFSKARMCRPDAVPQSAPRLAEFVAGGYHGQMGWMAERMHWRGAPDALWPEARSVIMLAESYAPKHDPREDLNRPEHGAISVYAQNRDYHDIVKKRLKAVGRWLIEQQPGAEIKVFVDTAPVMEKPLAQAAGLGWQGKHTNLLARDLGNWFFLGAIFTTVEFDPDLGEISHCGSCTSCLDACPTQAFIAPYRLDPRRCISYLTIEHDGPIDPELRGLMGNHIYGCDDCLAACPWNKFAVDASDIRYAARDDVRAPALAELARLDDAAFRARFSGNPVKRIGRNRFLRNVLYAMGNSGNRAFMGDIAPHIQDPDPVVQDAAQWAINQLNSLN